MTIFVSHVGPHISNIAYFDVYVGMWGYMWVHKGIQSYIGYMLGPRATNTNTNPQPQLQKHGFNFQSTFRWDTRVAPEATAHLRYFGRDKAAFSKTQVRTHKQTPGTYRAHTKVKS